MVNWNVIVIVTLIAAFIGVILWISLPGLIEFADTQEDRDLLNDISETEKMMCGIPNEMNVIFDKINSISSDNFDNKAKGIYQSILWGNNIDSCDISYLYEQLDNQQKEKLNWNKFSCTNNHCTK
ncbi:MAG: hypothetical protein HOK63_02420 [Thaumarchaeota archaeon]|jgi:hypothetical protein|nr:hypothetical protein [Nitrososphaerota archaeon]MBT5843104.1 hypothetical protein [Nitrososphaerota archaeon]MBT6468493.1 hypothetical protein [Nitrososphaerota archaeon]